VAQKEYSLLAPYKFFLLFFGVLFALHLAFELILDSDASSIIDITGILVVVFAKPFGIHAVYEDTFITVSGFTMHIDTECAALHYISIFIAAVFASPSNNISYKIKGILTGTVIITFINIVRIAVLGLTGANFPAIFDFIHIYLWQGAFAIAVFIVWLSWARGASADKSLMRFCSVAIVVSGFAIFGLWLVMESYLNVLAGISEGVFHAFLINNSFSIGSTKDMITFKFNHSGLVVNFPIWVDVFDSSIFFALMIASAKANDIARLAIKLMCGMGILSLVHLIFVMVIGYLVVQKVGIDSELVDNTLLIMRIFSIIIPIALWALMSPKKWAWQRETRQVPR
jgi:exosortase/archaeosortase family protein